MFQDQGGYSLTIRIPVYWKNYLFYCFVSIFMEPMPYPHSTRCLEAIRRSQLRKSTFLETEIQTFFSYETQTKIEGKKSSKSSLSKTPTSQILFKCTKRKLNCWFSFLFSSQKVSNFSRRNSSTQFNRR